MAVGNEHGRYQVRIHSVLTGKLILDLGRHLDRVSSIAWSRDDDILVTSSSDYTAKVISLGITTQSRIR